MFRKVMGISDALMWRYWELLTDATPMEISEFRSREPMEVKMELATRIVKDFYNAADALRAREDFNREVRQGAEPDDIETVPFPAGASTPQGTHVPKLLVAAGLAASRTEAERLLKSGAVEIDGERWSDLIYPKRPEKARVGKKWKKFIAA
jgi:tyrosyl-tRNA synthetase